ncbi:hypothetical protein R1sor_021450 [Riccia sorocarpa]|uniref:NAD(P)-binding protein n=1 Tax=Riccia sorocarpa TaxID=122646 RepID=A0ABD3GJ90_9MARC
MPQKKVAIVTGANTGIGRETSLELARKGMKVFLACRDMEKGRHALNYIQDGCPEADVELLHLDLQSLESVRRCASEFKSRKLPLNLLVNNAGLNSGSSYSADGIHVIPQVNFLGPYTFTRLLEDVLTWGAPSRVVNVSSIMHRLADDFEADEYLTKTHGRYSNSKLANVLFTHEAQLRWQGQGIESSAVDPGSVASEIFRSYSAPMRMGINAFYSPTWDAAKIVVHAATAPYSEDKKDSSKPFRFFARGAFASPLITATPPPLLVRPQALVMLLGSLLDWPIRRLSGGALWSQVKEVPAHKQAYNKKLSSRLWDKVAVIAGFEKE